MKISIDVSIFIADGRAFGNLSGTIDFSIAPLIGDALSFLSPHRKTTFPADDKFSGLLKVTDRILPCGGVEGMSVALSPITASDRESAIRIADYFEKGFDLFLVEYRT